MSLFRLSLLLAAFLLTGCASTCLVGVKRPYADPEGTVPRMVFLPEVPNLRDLGGWRTVGGKVVRQGMIYRSGRLNERWRWYRVGPARDILSDETRRFLVEDLGIRTEIDLRKEVNCRGMVESPLGPSVKFVNIPSKAYDDLLTSAGRDAVRRAFKEFLRPENYPILFHCEGGNDRAGALAFILNGLLGVDEADLRKDWRLSRVWNGRADSECEQRLARLEAVFDGYKGRSVHERVKGYVLSLGFSEGDIGTFKSLMLAE